MLLFPLWSFIASILYQPVSSAVTYDRFQFINEVSKKKKKKKQKKIQDFINTQCFMAATGFKYFFTHCSLTESFITIHCFSTLTCFKWFYINPGAKFLVDINSQHFSFGAWPNGLFILAHKPNSVVCHHPVFTYCDILKELHYQP